MPRLERVRADHEAPLLAFELANRDYFARSISDRGDAFYAQFADHHRASLDEHATGACAFHVLVEDDGEITGRFNLYDIAAGTANVGYRIAERVSGRGVATRALRELCGIARTEYRLRRLVAVAGDANLASRRVLVKAGFVATHATDIAGRPATAYLADLRAPDPT